MKPPEWALAQYEHDDGPRIGALVDGRLVAGPPAVADLSLMQALAHWDDSKKAMRSWTPDPRQAITHHRVIAPLTYPSKVICVGANYYAHIAEMGIARPPSPPEPWFFLKPPTTTVIGSGEPIRLPGEPEARVDWEVELGVVIGRRCKNLTTADVNDNVAGYVVANDISSRDKLSRSDAIAEPFTYDWVGHKGRDTFCPLGPGLVPSWLVPDPQRLEMTLSVNGVEKQRGSTSGMISPIIEVVAAASRLLTLEPGDVVLTGTPAGVGMPKNEFLAAGDTVIAEVEMVGQLVNPVVSG